MPLSKSQTLLVASGNSKKLKELNILLAGLNFNVIGLSDFPNTTEVEENGNTFEDNAKLKALGYAQQTGQLTLAEDSGICCDALEGAPGVYSARFAGEKKDDHANNLKLLRLLENIPDNCRGAYFISCIAIATPEKVLATMEGRVSGFIGREIRGDKGFGYDSLFYYPPFDKHFGEVPSAMKNEVSHRSKALKKAKEFFKDFQT